MSIAFKDIRTLLSFKICQLSCRSTDNRVVLPDDIVGVFTVFSIRMPFQIAVRPIADLTDLLSSSVEKDPIPLFPTLGCYINNGIWHISRWNSRVRMLRPVVCNNN